MSELIKSLLSADLSLRALLCPGKMQARVYAAEHNDEMQFKTLLAFCRHAFAHRSTGFAPRRLRRHFAASSHS